MDTASAFAMGEANKHRTQRVFDWNKAAQRIREVQPETASAGLAGDWEWTGGEIYSNGEIDTDSYTYLSSTWATPELDMDGDTEDCWCYQSSENDWDASTKWPDSARAILLGELIEQESE